MVNKCPFCDRGYSDKDLTDSGKIPAHLNQWLTCPGSYHKPKKVQEWQREVEK